MYRFLLVRHATPMEGADPPLSVEGLNEAELLARRLAGERLDAAWSSDLKRAAETAAAILDARISPVLLKLSPLLREVEVPPSVGEADYAEREQEVVDQLASNVSLWLTQLEGELGPAGTSPDRTILVVAHAGLLRVLVCRLLGVPLDRHWSFRFDMASLSVVEHAGDMGTAMLLNDRCHLERG